MSAREVGTGLILKFPSPTAPVIRSSTRALLHALYSNLCVSKVANGCMFWILRLFADSHNGSHAMSPQRWKVFCCGAKGRVLSWGIRNLASGYGSVKRTHFSRASVSPSINGEITTSLPTSQCSWGSTNTTDCECVWGKLSTFSHLEDTTIPFREPVAPTEGPGRTG